MNELSIIIQECKNNNPKYQNILYKKLKPSLLNIAKKYTNNSHDAHDVLQEGFIKIFKYINTFSNNNSFEGWCRRIIINTAINNYNRNKKHTNHLDINEINQIISYQINDFNLDEITYAINKLPIGYKTVFNLYEIQGYKHKEIADKLNIDVNTSKSQLSRAKKYIQKELKKLSN